MKTTSTLPKDGDIINIYGVQMMVKNFRRRMKAGVPVMTTENEPRPVYLFEGTPLNDETLLKTSYNGGTYSWRPGEAFNSK